MARRRNEKLPTAAPDPPAKDKPSTVLILRGRVGQDYGTPQAVSLSHNSGAGIGGGAVRNG
ncbi:hypothetical protein MetexDRAFT_6695 [Methylorubrum extorquens DSM 13060]|uniref:Uncharacterized protein n=1 Tax=Methylorubrum extorquens DSM 13060 TaxID=882800 RepID=H1KVN2_METEX|nr:hypothetical protein MetexDRAFT_6695 [Methylorubrum extorquens DSM 13060]